MKKDKKDKYPVKVTSSLSAYYATLEKSQSMIQAEVLVVYEKWKEIQKNYSEMNEAINKIEKLSCISMALIHNSMVEPLDKEEK